MNIGVKVVNSAVLWWVFSTYTKDWFKGVLIDSSLQHAASAFNLPSTVLWVGTSPKVFGYNIHANIEAKLPTKYSKLMDSYLFDYSFEGKHYECPFIEGIEIFDKGLVYKSLH